MAKQDRALAKDWCHKNICRVRTIVAEPIVAVIGEVQHGGKFYFAPGGARCCHLDEFDADRGLEIAIGRAAVDIAQQLVEAGVTPWLAA